MSKDMLFYFRLFFSFSSTVSPIIPWRITSYQRELSCTYLNAEGYSMRDSPVILFIMILAALFYFTPVGASAQDDISYCAAAEEDSGTDTQGSPEWIRHARVAGLGVSVTMPVDMVEKSLDGLVNQGVTAVVIDSSLGEYLSDELFTMQIDFARKVTESAHVKGLKVIWYYPALQATTIQGKVSQSTMRKDHPLWIQRNFDRRGVSLYRHTSSGEKLNIYDEETQTVQYVVSPFTGGSGDEVAWLCPSGPYREYFFNRVEKLAAAGMDGIEFDTAYFAAGDGIWPCADSHCQRTFTGETGFPFPGRASFADSAFRQWILWRHKALAGFLKGAALAARRSNPSFSCFVHMGSCDHISATREGLDAGWLDSSLNLTWELDVLSGTTGMRDASVGDWLSMMVTHRFFGGMRQGAPGWGISAGIGEEDSQLIMASILAARCNPHETRIPGLISSVGKVFRTRMFKWIAREQSNLFDCTSNASVAILYSSETRDFVDGTEDGGLYITSSPPTPAVKWWVKSRKMALNECSYLSEYKGWGFFLIQNHIPFDVRPLPNISIEELLHYRLVILPNTVCLKDRMQSLLCTYLAKGGSLIITGEDAGLYDELGNRRKTSRWKEKSFIESSGVRDRVLCYPSLVGKGFLSLKVTSDTKPVKEYFIRQGITPIINETAPLCVQSYRKGGDLIVHLLNYRWVGTGGMKVEAQKARLSIPLQGARVKAVKASCPEWEGEDKVLPFTVEGDMVVFDVNVAIHQLIKVECEQ